MTPEEMKEMNKEAVKEALESWLDKQFSTIGKWTLKGLLSMLLVAVVYLYAAAHGWSFK